MDPHDFGGVASHDAVPETFPDNGRDHDASAPTTSPAVAPASRHLYTMTVDQVASELYTYRIVRDERTIQRWCKAGKLRAIIDHEHGDRYVVDPASVRDMVAAILAERDAEAVTPRPVTRPFPDSDAAPRPAADRVATTPRFEQAAQADTHPDSRGHDAADDATPREGRDEVAALRRRIAELEQEKVMLVVDKEVREKMVEYLKEQFNQMIDHALDRSERVGALEAENRQLRALLPSGDRPAAAEPTNEPEEAAPAVYGTPRSYAPSSASMHRHTPWEPS